MKEVLQILSTLMALLLGGCATQQLSVDKHGKKLAPRLGTKESEIQFLSYGFHQRGQPLRGCCPNPSLNSG